MSTKSHNAKKPKLAHLPTNHTSEASPMPGTEPGKHHLSFAQHQHEQQADANAHVKLQEEQPQHELKSDAQQHQQKSGGHK